MSSLRIRDLQRSGLQPVSLEVAAGECVAIYGPSGAGKSLLLRAIADLDPNQGMAWLDERARSELTAPQWRRQVAYLAADSHWWTERVGGHASDWSQPDLQAMGFNADVLDWEVHRLSSGERQRLALVRGLAHRPAALLLDEPTANLDSASALRVEQLIADYRHMHQAAVIWVSHTAEQRARVATRCYRIENGVLESAAAPLVGEPG